jgi:hypothetical protein
MKSEQAVLPNTCLEEEEGEEEEEEEEEENRIRRNLIVCSRQTLLHRYYNLHSAYPPGALFLGVKRLGREADHSPPCSAEVKE